MQFVRVLIQRSSRFVAALVIAIAMPALALDEEGSRAGRVASVQGALSHKADDAAAWVPVEQNYPVAEGASLALAPGGRAEIDYGGGLFRLDGGTEVRVTRLTDHDFALFVGVAMSITAFPVLARILTDRGLSKTPIGRRSLIAPVPLSVSRSM